MFNRVAVIDTDILNGPAITVDSPEVIKTSPTLTGLIT